MNAVIETYKVLSNHSGMTVNRQSSLLLLNKQAYNVDPTRTTMLRRAFIRDMNKRIDQLRREIRIAIVDKDVFGLENVKVNAELGAREFKFKTSQKKVDGFMNWLRGREQQGLLKTTTINQMGESVQRPWTNTYIEDSYKRGVMRANAEMKKLNVPQPGMTDETLQSTMSNPFHAERVGVLYSRVFEELKGITAQMDQQISRVLSQGLIDGDNPQLLAGKVNKAITGIGKNLDMTDTLGRFIPAKRRAQTLARTEIIRAHHQATIQQYKNWGLEGVKVKAEWSTAGDSRVCLKCSSMHGNVYTLKEVEHMIPAHPNCRCIALPTLDKKEQETGEPWKDLTLDDISNNYVREDTLFGLGIGGIGIEKEAYYLGKKNLLARINIAGKTIQDDIINKLPKVRSWVDEHITTPLSNRRVPLEFDSILNGKSTVTGTYSLQERTISIATKAIRRTTYTPTVGYGAHNIGGAALPSTVAHEYGHFMYYTKLGSDGRHAWLRISGPRKVEKMGKEVSRYGASNPEEFFAESFAAYTHKSYKLGDLPKDIEDFMINNFGKRSDL